MLLIEFLKTKTSVKTLRIKDLGKERRGFNVADMKSVRIKTSILNFTYNHEYPNYFVLSKLS